LVDSYSSVWLIALEKCEFCYIKEHIVLTKGLIKNIGFQVVVAMVLGALAGALMGEQATVFAPFGTLFIQLIKMLVIPLVAVAGTSIRTKR